MPSGFLGRHNPKHTMARDVSRAIHYRNAGFLPPSPSTLQQLLTAALAQAPLAVNRECPLGQDVFQILNTTATIRGTLCGSLHRWVHGQNQLIVERDLTAATWAIREVAPPPPPPGAAGAQGPQRDFLPYTLYFGVRANHVVVLQSQGIMAPELAHYLTWFIQQKVPALWLPNQNITMYPASAAMLRAHGVDNAKAVRVTRPMADLELRQPNGRHRKAWYEKVVPHARIQQMTDALRMMGIPAPRALLAHADAKDLEVYFEIRRPRGKDPLGNPVMNEIGKLAAEQDDDKLTVELLDGSELTGAKLKLSKDITLKVPDNRTHPSEMDIFREIDAYLRHLIASGMV